MKLADLIRKATEEAGPMSLEQRRAQAISFVYGNCHIENPNVTREMVEAAYDRLHPPQEAKG